MAVQGRLVAGTILVLLGIGLLLDARGVVDFGDLVGTYWPVLLIVLGVAALGSHPRRPLGGAILIVLGLVFLLAELGQLPTNWSDYVWPALLILFGLLVLLGSGRRRGHDWAPLEPTVADSETIRINAFLSGVDQVVRSNAFRGGKVDAVLGGARLDLRGAKLAPAGARLEVSVFMGGVEIFVPSTWAVQVRGTPFLGGVDDRTLRMPAAGGPSLEIQATATLGGVTIKN